MTRRFINEFTDQESIDQIFLVTGKVLRPNRNGDLYLQMELRDKTGSLTARMWNATESLYQRFENGDYLQVEGKTQIFQGAMQLIAKRFTKVSKDDINEEDFAQLATISIDKLTRELADILRNISDPHLQNLAECYLMDNAFMEKFTSAPAGLKHHHAYPGGLLQHTLDMMKLARKIGDSYPFLNTDLLVMGTFLHDTGKPSEIEFEKEFTYTNEGQLLGHIYQGIFLLEEHIHQSEQLSGEPFPAELALRLKHMILSHHGEYEFGSPKLPMTPEAQALHCIDLLDSKLAAFDQLIREDLNAESEWTNYIPSLQRKLFKGLPPSDTP
ncbi:MAG: HD domain-containing protein [Planctomycetia bacterium]|nr:HD domain-containing protein [Planctomycetia bacterium]